MCYTLCDNDFTITILISVITTDSWKHENIIDLSAWTFHNLPYNFLKRAVLYLKRNRLINDIFYLKLPCLNILITVSPNMFNIKLNITISNVLLLFKELYDTY